ncbi:MAG: exopolysaccharide biosynthesis protein [Rhodobacteraceae bacterium]|nr:MAG: exopolysaccharide biosynthesis protein [Paracoccaceae bacterium]
MKDYVDNFEPLFVDVTTALRESANEGYYAKGGKRVFDLILAVLLLPLIAPVVAALWLLVRRDGGPGFFGHRRIGRNGQEFKCWKVRTMVMGAEERLQSYLASNPAAAAEWARDHKLTNDPRITRFGDFLRKTSLDELPQIWNVLKSEMSFVGPRPIVRAELPKYGVAAGVYLRQKPGITGLWQVSGRNDVSYTERVAMDVDYSLRGSLMFDMELIARTGISVMGGTGR